VINITLEILAEHKLEGISFYYIDARSVGNARLAAQVKVVPLLQVYFATTRVIVLNVFIRALISDVTSAQCWRNGQMLESYIAEGQLSDAEIQMKEFVERWCSASA
jgi:hypothetical protein